MEDITALIQDDHEAFRRGFARLDDVRDPAQARAVWQPLALHLEIHADAEETIFYPMLLQNGEDAEGETADAIRDHNKIRDAIAEAGRQVAGSDEWWAAVWTVRRENSEHLTEEEDEVLPDFRRHSSRELRHQLGTRWLAFYASHPNGRGLQFRNKDPGRYLNENT